MPLTKNDKWKTEMTAQVNNFNYDLIPSNLYCFPVMHLFLGIFALKKPFFRSRKYIEAI